MRPLGLLQFQEIIGGLQQRERERDRQQRDPLPGAPPPAAVVRLPIWPQAVRGVPNGFIRSALFAAIGKGRRRYISGEDAADGPVSERAEPVSVRPATSRIFDRRLILKPNSGLFDPEE